MLRAHPDHSQSDLKRETRGHDAAEAEREERLPRSAAAVRLSAEDLGLPESVECPFCSHSETELHSGFGSQLSVATYWCRRCHTAFEYIKWQDRQK